MKIHLKPEFGPSRTCKIPYEGAKYVIVNDWSCPCCTNRCEEVYGGQITKKFDRYISNAYCQWCDSKVGLLIAVVDTVFGIEEDERIMSGRYGKVY